jgi:hypothetical protein
MSDVYKAMMEQYEKSHTNTSNNSKKYDLKNYFSTYLPKGTDSATKRIRILPPDEGLTTSFTVLWGHKMKVDGEWKTFPCLDKEEGKACPFCEAREKLLAQGDDESKELAKKYSARKMYVVKVIDRDKEHEGVKFWRFNHNYKKEGVYDKIMGALKAAQHDITDAQTGRDLILDIQRDGTNNVPGVKAVNNSLEVTPLHENENTSNEWTSDARTWRDVYSVRDYDYLFLIVCGKVPMWDKKNEKWADKEELTNKETKNESDNLDSELSMGNPNSQSEGRADREETVAQPVSVNNDSNDDEDDDLPF